MEAAAAADTSEAGWKSLPTEVKCCVLSALPTTKKKLALKYVSKEWHQLLSEPESHSLERELIAFEQEDGLAEWPRDDVLEGSRTLELELFHSCPKLPGSLEDLLLHLGRPFRMCREVSFPSLPYLPRLNKLVLWVGKLWAPPLNHNVLPALRQLEIYDLTSVYDNFKPWCEKLCTELYKFNCLVTVKFRCLPDFVNIKVPKTCSVHYIDLVRDVKPREYLVLGQAASALTSLNFRVIATTPNVVMDVSNLHSCHNLVKLGWMVMGYYQIERSLKWLEYGLLLHGVDTLPPSVRALEIVMMGGRAKFVDKPSCVTRIEEKVYNGKGPVTNDTSNVHYTVHINPKPGQKTEQSDVRLWFEPRAGFWDSVLPVQWAD